MAAHGKFILLKDWERYCYADLRKKLAPPHPWYRQRSDDLDTLNYLDGRLYGALCRLRMLACIKGNPIENREIYLRGRCGVTQKTLAKLHEHGLIDFVDERPVPEKTNKNNSKIENYPEKGRMPVRIKSVLEGEKEIDIKTEGPGKGNTHSRRIAGNGAAGKSGQPAFEEMTRACMKAGVRGSDYRGISEVIKDSFGFQPTTGQLLELEKQIIDRRRE